MQSALGSKKACHCKKLWVQFRTQLIDISLQHWPTADSGQTLSLKTQPGIFNIFFRLWSDKETDNKKNLLGKHSYPFLVMDCLLWSIVSSYCPLWFWNGDSPLPLRLALSLKLAMDIINLLREKRHIKRGIFLVTQYATLAAAIWAWALNVSRQARHFFWQSKQK